ncbi:ubiquinone biosynthesis O-methyltransferase, mitochondrial-like [Aricia agestis]|uniref:ubiquinone biosynthesis O-methyltransferase, mitochondrial-like n=1 Tax=Aricia agestis TaxID=91739 RepID=UPI001C2046DE|nr:ubiquinone biosynthesis O-methyltransferase, mitochondrial-like [Aricia agestis]
MNNTIIQKPFVKMLLSSNLFRANLITSVHKALGNINQSTVDEDEIRKHTLMSKDWWDVNGSMKALHSLNNIRVPFVRDGLVYYPENKRPIRPLEGKSILDVGCGGGILSEPLARLGASVTGIDASQELIDLATEHSQKNAKLTTKPSYICTSIEEHSCDNKECYDGVVASEIIEHVNNKELFIKSCLDTLKPGGRIFFTTPNRTRLTQVFGICVAEYVMKLVPKGTHDYEKLTTPTELTFLLERNNCHVEAVFGLMYYPLLNRWEWFNSPIMMFALQAVKCEEKAE